MFWGWAKVGWGVCGKRCLGGGVSQLSLLGPSLCCLRRRWGGVFGGGGRRGGGVAAKVGWGVCGKGCLGGRGVCGKGGEVV